MRTKKDTIKRRGSRTTEVNRNDRSELLLKAETLGLDELGWIHGGAESSFGCCGWGTIGNCRNQGCGV